MARGIVQARFVVTRWKVMPEARKQHAQAVDEMMRHTIERHPRITGSICMSFSMDEFIHIADVGSLPELEKIVQYEDSPECDVVWENIRKHMVPGSMSITFWNGISPQFWKSIEAKPRRPVKPKAKK